MKKICDFVAPQNKYTLFKLLYSGQLPLNPLWQKFSYRLKFALRTFILAPKTITWLDHLANYNLLGYFLSRQSNLPCKLQRPYLTTTFNSKACLDALVFHYDFLSSKNPALTHALYGENPFLLATIIGKNEQKFNVVIHSEDKYSREGELTIYMFDDNGCQLATLTFSLIKYEGKTTLFIAGLQGATGDDAKKRIQQATKSCFGIFPKRMVLEAALNFAKALGFEQVVAVGNQSHIYNNWRYKSRFKQLHSDYDDFWLTLDAHKNQAGLFTIPLTIARKSIEDIASKKRSEYRNRYALLDNLEHDVQQHLLPLI
ncbi:VirK/YbjX family protein [Orbaceae bacterium ac157xtp]